MRPPNAFPRTPQFRAPVPCSNTRRTLPFPSSFLSLPEMTTTTELLAVSSPLASRTSHQLGQTETLRTGCLSFSSAQSRTRILGAARTRPRMSPPRRTRVRPIHRRLNRRSKRSKHCRGKRGGGELKTNVLVVVCVVYLDDDT